MKNYRNIFSSSPRVPEEDEITQQNSSGILPSVADDIASKNQDIGYNISGTNCK